MDGGKGQRQEKMKERRRLFCGSPLDRFSLALLFDKCIFGGNCFMYILIIKYIDVHAIEFWFLVLFTNM